MVLWLLFAALESALTTYKIEESKMKRSTLLGAVITALLTLCVTATSALAAPSVTVLPGESTSKVTSTGEQKGADAIETASGTQMTATLEKLVLVWVFPFFFLWEHVFTQARQGAKACLTTGEPSETVLLKGEGKPVFTALSPLRLGLLVSVAETTITCGTVEGLIKGSLLEAFNGTLGSDITTFKGSLKGSKGSPALTKYFNSEGKEALATLLTNFGAGFVKSDINIASEVEYKNSSMLNFTG